MEVYAWNGQYIEGKKIGSVASTQEAVTLFPRGSKIDKALRDNGEQRHYIVDTRGLPIGTVRLDATDVALVKPEATEIRPKNQQGPTRGGLAAISALAKRRNQ